MITLKALLNQLEIFIIFLAILFKYLLNAGISQNYLYILIAIMMFLTLMSLYYKKMTKNQLLKCSIFLIISAYFVVVNKDVNFLISFLLALVCFEKDERQFIKTFLLSSIILYLVTIILGCTNVLESHNLYRTTDDGIKIRYSLGFVHPNSVFLFFLPIAFAGYYLYGERLLYKIILLVSSVILFILSDCRTGFAIIILLLVLDALIKERGALKIKNVLPYLFIIFTIVSVFIAVKCGDDLDNVITNALSDRPYYWKKYIDNGLMFTLVGNQEIKQYFIDNFYILLLVGYGVIGYLIYMYSYYKSLKIMKPDKRITLITLLFIIYGLFESNVIIGSIQFVFALQLKELITYSKKKSISNKQVDSK